jgi:predicted nucleic acid-binding protein
MVVADTSSVNYAILIGEIEILQQLYGVIAIAEAVLKELSHPKAPEKVRTWIANHPAWLEVHSVVSNLDPTLAHLGNGEREAIILAELLGATLLMDERDGRIQARRRGLPLTGLIGALLDASERGLTDLPQALARLQHTTFHLSRRLVSRLLKKS